MSSREKKSRARLTVELTGAHGSISQAISAIMELIRKQAGVEVNYPEPCTITPINRPRKPKAVASAQKAVA